MSQMGLFAALAKLAEGSTIQEPLSSKLPDAEGMRAVPKDALKSTTPPASEMFGGLEGCGPRPRQTGEGFNDSGTLVQQVA